MRGLTNSFSSSANNGNITGQTLNVPGMGSTAAAYIYDGANRIVKSMENASTPSASSCKRDRKFVVPILQL